MVDAGRLPPLGPAAMFMVRFLGIIAKRKTLLYFTKQCAVLAAT
jgi:hypothetical protein